MSENLSHEHVTRVQNLLRDYAHIFSDKPSLTNVAEHHTDVQGATPIRQHPYRIPHSWREQYAQEIEDMMKEGIIVKSNSEWASPVVLVPKKQDGKQTGIRVCIDFRKVNALTRFDAFPLPRIEDLIDKLGSGQILSKLDLTKGYWGIPLTPDSRDKTWFSVSDTSRLV